LENFTRKQLIAQGGMSDVYIASDSMSGKDVAWKEAHNRFNPLHFTNAKLQGEAELLQIINHNRLPGFITLGEVSNVSGSTCGVLIEEFIEGGDLKATVEQVKKMGMNLPASKIIELMSHICEPLIHMTRLPEPVYHRDLKPHNIIVHPERGPVLIDFGLAKMVASGQDVSITRGGSGTWSPPERDSGISGPFTDVYSLGKILFYLATGNQPPTIMTHADKDQMIAMNHPEWLANLMLSAAWPRHDDRLQNVHLFAQALANQGRVAQPSQGAAASDDFTTWG
jgi:serine/threonine-protein kinase